MSKVQSLKNRIEKLEQEDLKGEPLEVTIIHEVRREDGSYEQTERVIKILQDAGVLPDIPYQKDFMFVI